MKTKQQILHSLMEISNILRDFYRSDFVIECSASLFFLKRLTDLDDQMCELLGINGTPITFELNNFSWSNLASKEKSGVILLETLKKIEYSIPELNGLSTDSRLSEILSRREVTDEQYKSIFSILDTIPTGKISSKDVADIFQHLLDMMGEQAPSSITPPSVRKLMVGILAPNSKEAIYDPVCGSGSLLCEAASKNDEKFAMDLAGQDSHSASLVIARMNILLHGNRPNVHQGNTLFSPQHKDGDQLQKFDVILANPPFGTKLDSSELSKDKYRRFSPISPSSTEVAFVQHVVHSLNAKGRAAILAPNGILSRAGSDYKLRQHLVSTGRIEAVISLPSYLFSGTAISVTLLVLRGEESTDYHDRIIFIDLHNHADGPTTRRHLSDNGILEAIKCVHTHSCKEQFASLVPITEVAANDFNLSVERYVRVDNADGLLSFDKELCELYSAIKDRNRVESEALHAIKVALKSKSLYSNEELTND